MPVKLWVYPLPVTPQHYIIFPHCGWPECAIRTRQLFCLEIAPPRLLAFVFLLNFCFWVLTREYSFMTSVVPLLSLGKPWVSLHQPHIHCTCFLYFPFNTIIPCHSHPALDFRDCWEIVFVYRAVYRSPFWVVSFGIFICLFGGAIFLGILVIHMGLCWCLQIWRSRYLFQSLLTDFGRGSSSLVSPSRNFA